jgi:protein TonB
VVRAEPDRPPEPEPEIPPVEPEIPETPVPPEDVEVHDDPLVEPPIFESDPEDRNPDDLRLPSDVPPSPNKKLIGIGGGNLGNSGTPAPPPEPAPPPKPKGDTKKAKLREFPAPDYPRQAVRRNLEGEVLLLVEVLPTGETGRIEIRESSGHRLLDNAAIDAVKGWKFEAALVEGRPVRSFVEVPILFELKSRR